MTKEELREGLGSWIKRALHILGKFIVDLFHRVGSAWEVGNRLDWGPDSQIGLLIRPTQCEHSEPLWVLHISSLPGVLSPSQPHLPLVILFYSKNYFLGYPCQLCICSMISTKSSIFLS
jgi:hypothetical protein